MGTAALQDIVNTLQGSNLALAYGRHEVRGNNPFVQQLPGGNKIALFILGEGEWAGFEYLWINRKPIDVTDTTIVHFHPGQDGVLGHGLTPDSNGGDNLVDTFFGQIPTYTATTFSRKACLFLNVPPDPGAPSAALDVVGQYACLKVRFFDASGNQLGYQWTDIGAWQILDVILRKHLRPEWLTSQAAAAGGDLTAAEKARIDFPSVADAASWCSTVIASGNQRWQSSIAFTQPTPVRDAVNQLCMISQLFVHEAGGKIYIRADKPRSFSFTLKKDHVKEGTFQASEQTLHGAPNRFIVNIRDINPGKIVDIETPANSGLVRASNVVTVKTKNAVAHPFQVNDYIRIVNPDDASFATILAVASTAPSSFTARWQFAADATSGNGYVGTQESRYTQRTHTEDHEQHQLACGQRGLNLTPMRSITPITYDLGNTTIEQAQRTARFLKNRVLGLDQTPYKAPVEVQVTAHMYAVDDQNNALLAQLQGDVIHLDKSVSEEFQGDYEITSAAWRFPADPSAAVGSGSVTSSSASSQDDSPYIDLKLLQYIAGAFSDASDTAQFPAPALMRGDLPPVPTVGHNLLANPGFEIGGDNQFHTNLGNLASDLEITLNPGSLCQFKIVQGDGNARSGNAYLLIRLAAGVSVPTGTSEFRASTRAKIPVRVGDPIRIDSYRRWDQSAAVPANVTIQQTVSVVYYASDGTELGTAGPSISNSVQASFVAFGGGDTVPATLGGKVPAYVKVIFRMIVTNSTGGALNTGVNTYADLKFDDIVFTVQLSPFQADPTMAPMTPQGGNALSQSGTTTQINFGASTPQFPEAAIGVNSGSTFASAYAVMQFCWADLPTYAGGAVTYHSSPNNYDITGGRGRVYVGHITVTTGGGAVGTGGGNGACTADGTMIRQADGTDKLIEQCYADFQAGNKLQWFTPYGPDEVQLIEKLDGIDLFDLSFEQTAQIAKYKNVLRCAFYHTVKVWGLWEHVGEIYLGGRDYKESETKHLHDLSGVRVSIDGGVTKLLSRAVAGKGSVYKVKLQLYHIYLANGVWSHNALKPSI